MHNTSFLQTRSPIGLTIFQQKCPQLTDVLAHLHNICKTKNSPEVQCPILLRIYTQDP
jgi:hypothetical protein